MDLQTIVSWNVRGASKLSNRLNIRAVVQESGASLLCLKETKVRSWKANNILALGLGYNVGWLELPVRGCSRGFLTVWNKNFFDVVEFLLDNSWLGIRGSCSSSGEEFICINVYAPQKTTLKRGL